MVSWGYMTVGSNRLGEAKNFYDTLFGTVGITPIAEHPSGGRVYGKNGEFFFVVLGPFDGKPASVGNGSMFAFRFDSRGEVSAFHTKALQLGATDEGSPGERLPNFFAAYFRDLDGNKMCAYNFQQ